MNFEPEEIEIKNLNHLGIIAGIIDEIGIVEKVSVAGHPPSNELIGTDSREIINCGEVVKAIILNGMGFISGASHLCKYSVIVMNTVTLKIQETSATDDE